MEEASVKMKIFGLILFVGISSAAVVSNLPCRDIPIQENVDISKVRLKIAASIN